MTSDDPVRNDDPAPRDGSAEADLDRLGDALRDAPPAPTASRSAALAAARAAFAAEWNGEAAVTSEATAESGT